MHCPEVPMGKDRDLGDLLDRLDILERKVSILEEKVEESKRFIFDEIRQVLLRVMSIEDSISRLESRLQNTR
jgi:hypothetical protein